MIHNFYCSTCKTHKQHISDLTTGYATKRNGHKVCFACCGKTDSSNLVNGKFVVLYLDGNKQLQNWPGTLKIKGSGYTTRNNWGYPVEHVWFKHKGHSFYGRLTGESKQCLDFYKEVKA